MLKDLELIKWRGKVAELCAIEAKEKALQIKEEVTVLEEKLKLERCDSGKCVISNYLIMD